MTIELENEALKAEIKRLMTINRRQSMELGKCEQKISRFQNLLANIPRTPSSIGQEQA